VLIFLAVIMKELKINILRSPARSTVRRLLGSLYILLGILWLVTRIVNREPEPERFPLPFLDIIYILLFGFSGVVFLIEGSGISIGSWFGEAYIKIDTVGIFIKKGVFSKEWVILWDKIAQVEFSVIKIKFILKDKSFRELNYNNLEYEHIQEIKQSVRDFSAEKNIRCN
jgi:hypothetical protein